MASLNLPIIDTLNLTAPNGKSFITKLPLGGFGISRYTLDYELSLIAKSCGVNILHERVEDVVFKENKLLSKWFFIGFGVICIALIIHLIMTTKNEEKPAAKKRILSSTDV